MSVFSLLPKNATATIEDHIYCNGPSSIIAEYSRVKRISRVHFTRISSILLTFTICNILFNVGLACVSYHVSKNDALKEKKTFIKMDEPKTMVQEKKQARKVLTELKKAIREGRIFPEKQGRRIKKKVYLQEVSPEN
jgi:hypothetical protein